MRPVKSSSWPRNLSLKVYMQLLKLYPYSYRQKFAMDMQRTFDDCCRFAFQDGGVIGLFKLWMPTLADIGFTVVEKHLDEGVLSSRVVIRNISYAMLACSAGLYKASWDSATEILLLATVLFVLGGCGVFVTSPLGRDMIRRKFNLSDNVMHLRTDSQNQHYAQKIEKFIMDPKVRRAFRLNWITASGIGLVVGFGVYFSLVVDFASDLSIGWQIPISILGGTILGASIGYAQGLVLQQQVAQLAKWFIASTAGGAVGGTIAFTLGTAVGDVAGFYVALAVGGAVIGASMGIAEWLLLRKQLSRSSWWVLASTVGIVVALTLSDVLGAALYYGCLELLGDAVATVLAMFMFGGLLLTGYGAITGTVLVWLLQQPVTNPVEPS